VLTLTVTRAVLALRGVPSHAVEGTEVTPQVTRALRARLVSHGFDMRRSIRIRELDHDQGYKLTQ
jgi:hypothetical protein